MKSFLSITFILAINLSIFAQWTPISPPPTGFRTDHTFGFAINDVGYLVSGSVNFNETSDFYSYDATLDQWTQLVDFPGGTRGFGIGDVHGGKGYFGFGRGSMPGQSNVQRNDLWEFDPTSGNWTELASCPCLTRLHPAMVANQGKIYVGLGNNSTVGNMNDWWEYDIANDSWLQKADFPSFKRHHPYQFSIGNNVYVGFGHGTLGAEVYKELYQYNPATDSWTQVSDIPGEGRVAGTQFSHNGYGYVLSGDGQTHSSMSEGEFWRYDATNDSWLQMPSHPGKSRWAPASFIINDEIYLINGAETPAYFYPSTSFKFNLNVATSGISENALIEELAVYPNPFSSEISLDLSSLKDYESLSLAVFNALGQKVHTILIDENLSPNVDLNSLEKGVYWLEVSSEGQKLGARQVVKSE